MGYYERLRLEVRGKPHWEGKPGQLTVEYEDIDDTFRVYQPVTVTADSTANPTGGEVAAFDLGINTLVACSTTTGRQYQYRGRDLFERFRETTEETAQLGGKTGGRPAHEYADQATLPDALTLNNICQNYYYLDRIRIINVSAVIIG
jgi:hypothetical protein